MPTLKPVPVLINEDDHENFGQPANNFTAAVAGHVSWGWFDFRMEGEGMEAGYQSLPVNWGINSGRKRAFFWLCAEITGAGNQSRARGVRVGPPATGRRPDLAASPPETA